jgi:hypothetical protein
MRPTKSLLGEALFSVFSLCLNGVAALFLVFHFPLSRSNLDGLEQAVRCSGFGFGFDFLVFFLGYLHRTCPGGEPYTLVCIVLFLAFLLLFLRTILYHGFFGLDLELFGFLLFIFLYYGQDMADICLYLFLLS